MVAALWMFSAAFEYFFCYIIFIPSIDFSCEVVAY